MKLIAQTNPASYPPNWKQPDGYSPIADAPVAEEDQWRLQIIRGLQVNGTAHFPGEILRHADFIPSSDGEGFHKYESFQNMISAGQIQWVPPSVWSVA